MGERYVVVVTHNTGHGEFSNPVMITSDIVRAVTVARGVQALGFEFYGREVGAIVYRMIEDGIYRKNDFKWYQDNLPPRTMVFGRMHVKCHVNSGVNCKWEEEWFDDQLRRKVDRKVSAKGKK